MVGYAPDVSPEHLTLEDVRRQPPRNGIGWSRRIVTGVLLVIVVCGAVGVFGVHSRTAHTSSGGYDLSVTYPQSARAGLDVPFEVVVRHAGGFGDSVTLAISRGYFRMFESQGFFPDTDSSTADGQFVYLTFSAPPGDVFTLWYDAYIQPAQQIGKSAEVKLLSNGGKVLAETSLRTWLVP